MSYRVQKGRKVRDMIKIVKKHGWTLSGQEGDHRQFEHPGKSGKVTIAGHARDTIPLGTQKSVLQQAGLYKD